MTAKPTWTDSGQGDLLALVAMGAPSTGAADEEWNRFVQALEAASDLSGRISPNFLRGLLRGNVAPRRIGAFTNRALRSGLVAYTGDWETSDDTEGRNSGKPCRVMRWTGTT